MLILTTLLVSSCSSVKKIEIASVPVERIPLNLPHVDPIQLEALEWYVVTEKNVQKVIATLEKKGYDAVIFGLSDKGYEILALNIAKIKAMTEQQRAKIKAYEEYYTNQNKKLDDMEKSQQDKIKEADKKNEKADKDSFMNKAKSLFGGK